MAGTRRRDILFVSNNFPPVIGGSTVVYDQICRNAADDIVAVGSRFNQVTGQLFPGLEAFDAACPYPIHRRTHLRPPMGVENAAGILARLYRAFVIDARVMLGTALFLTSIILRYRIKVVCLGELLYCGWLIFPLRYLLGRRVILYTHGEEISQDADCFLARRRGLFLRHANAIVAVSLFCKSQIVSLYGVDARKIFVIPNGVDVDVFRRGAAEPDRLPDSLRDHPVVLSVSRLVARKGQETLIRAFPRILAQVPEARCAIVGAGPLADHLAAVTRELGLEDKVIFLGSVPLDTLASLYRTCDVFALPCRTMPDGDTEGFGLVFLEANACGMPVVAGAAGGTVEAVIEGETGLIVDGNDPGEVAGAVIRILTDTALARRLGETGWNRAQRWGWSQVAGMFVSLCRGLPSQATVSNGYVAAAPASFAPSGKDGAPDAPRFLMTVDVEEEFNWDHFVRDGYHVRGADALEAYHADCVALGVSPLYFATYPMLRDPVFGRFFERVMTDGSGEVGIHLHSWITPPFWEQPNAFNSFQCNLPAHIERAKIERLCRTFEDRFGRPARLHRAGRWGGGAQTSAILEEMGIQVDFSPSNAPGDPRSGAPGLGGLDGLPFWAGPGGEVLTLPASAVRYLRGPKWVSSMIFSMLGTGPRSRSLGTAVRFSPEGLGEETMAAMIRHFNVRRQPVVVSVLHSTSLYPGGSPYAASPEMAAAVRARSVAMLRDGIACGLLRPSTAAEVLDAARRARCQGEERARDVRLQPAER